MLRGAVVVALLSQLSQQCGAALVPLRDKVSRSTSFSRVVVRRALVPSCVVAQAPAHSVVLGQAPDSQACGVGTRKKQYRS